MQRDADAARRMRVLLYTNLFPTPCDPTRGVFTLQLARELSAICDLVVICPLPWFPKWPWLKRYPRWYAFAEVPAEYEIEGLRVHSPKYPIVPKVSEPMLARLMYRFSVGTVRKLHARAPFDLINAMWLYPDAVAAGRIGETLGIPMVPTALGCDVNRMLDETDKRNQIRSMLERAPRITTVSKALRDALVGRGLRGDAIDPIPNGVNLALFYPRDRFAMRRMLGLKDHAKIILYVGRLSSEKGIETLISAASMMKSERAAWQLCIAGEGPLEGALRMQSAELGIEENVRFVGNVAHHDVATWMGACDVFCLPSIREGYPNVVIEALASGRPVVATRVGGIPEMVREDTGLLVPPGDVAALASALDSAALQDWSAERIAASMASETWGAAAQKYASVYQKVMSRGSSEIR